MHGLQGRFDSKPNRGTDTQPGMHEQEGQQAPTASRISHAIDAYPIPRTPNNAPLPRAAEVAALPQICNRFILVRGRHLHLSPHTVLSASSFSMPLKTRPAEVASSARQPGHTIPLGRPWWLPKARQLFATQQAPVYTIAGRSDPGTDAQAKRTPIRRTSDGLLPTAPAPTRTSCVCSPRSSWRWFRLVCVMGLLFLLSGP